MPLNRPNDKPRPPANPAATVYVNNVSTRFLLSEKYKLFYSWTIPAIGSN